MELRNEKLVGVACIFVILCLHGSSGEDKTATEASNDKDKWKKKDIRDYSEADMERLLDQWEDNDEDELEPDELPEWKKEPPKIDLSQLDRNNPEEMLKMSKKGRTLMMFATVSGNPTKKETDEISLLWHTSLNNANIQTQRFQTGDDRVIFMVSDGAKAWDIKDYLVTQDRCEEVTIEGKSYPGKGASKQAATKDNKTKKNSKPVNTASGTENNKANNNKEEL